VLPHDPGRFILVDITNLAGEIATLALDVTNVYLVGYRVGNSSFFFRPDNADTRAALHYLFEGTSRFDLHCTARYGDIGNIARLPRESALGDIRLYIELGPYALDRAITSMNRYARRRTPLILHAVARGLIVCIQMVSEAARFRAIETAMSSRIESDIDYPPGHSIVGLENQWRPMSEALQRTTNGGVLANLTLERNDGVSYQVTEISWAIAIIALMKFDCRGPRQSPSPRELTPPPVGVIKLVTTKATSESEPICPDDFEPKVRILGPNGLCVDVKEDGYYNNGNPIQLRPCKSNGDQIQLWTFKKDGTIQSNGKCLASQGNNTPGDKIVIYDCMPGGDQFAWQVWDNGTIISKTGLVLAANSSASRTQLLAQLNEYTTGQSWLPTNTTEPPVYQIAALSGLYLHGLYLHAVPLPEKTLHADEVAVLLLDISDATEELSWWALYPDSSIRPDQQRKGCLAPPPTDPRETLRIVSCDPSSSLQTMAIRKRWNHYQSQH
jgi:hypothetical protein